MRVHPAIPSIPLTLLAALLFLGAALSSCVRRPDAGTGPADAVGAQKSEVSAEAERRKKLVATKIPLPQDLAVDRASGAYIVICHVEAPKKRPGTTRTREEALALAQKTLERAKAAGADFEAIAREVSEGPDAQTTGASLGIQFRGHVSPTLAEIVEPLFRMKVGEISEITDTSQGFVILKRLPIDEYGAAQVYVQFSGAMGATLAEPRSHEEAKSIAEKARDEARAPGARFEDVVEKYSDDYDRLKKLGGFMGVYSKRDLKGGEQEGLGKALFPLKLGEISDVVESAYGYHVLKRIPAEPYRMTASQIVVHYAGSMNAKPGLKRTKEEAKAIAEGLLKEIVAGKDFREVARQSSEHPSAKDGGYIGEVFKGYCAPAFEEAAFTLQPGEVSVVVETHEGFHIIWRLE